MRLLVTIPHFCRQDVSGNGIYGSEREPAGLRRDSVSRCLASLHQTFGSKQALAGNTVTQANTALRAHVEVIVVTSHGDHLVDRLPRHLFFHQPTTVDPRALGFVCHNLMRDSVDRFDWFVFLEDDIGVTDPLLFEKLAWFDSLFGPQALLQPNRYEVAPDLVVQKLYVDGDTTIPELSAQFQNTADRRYFQAEAFGKPVLFQRVDNVHSGCFFVNARQLRRLMASPRFGVANDDFFGPLESAATLPIMSEFNVYKPARENAAFLEVQHLGRRFLHRLDEAPIPAGSFAMPVDGGGAKR